MRMTSAAISFLLLAAPALLAEEGGSGIPSVLFQEAYEQPVWVSQSGLESDPSLLSAVLPPGTIEAIERSASPDACIEIAVQDESSSPGSERLADYARKAERILLGQVVEHEAGIFQGRPGTLLRLRIQRAVSGRARGGDELVFVPVGEVRIGTARLCGSDRKFSTVPALGQEVLLLVPSHWFNTGEILFVGGSRGFLPIVDGQVRSLSRTQGEPDFPSRKEDFIRWLEELRSERSGS